MNTYYVAGIPYSDSLYHHGVKGQKWGIRRYQNPDGTLTGEGRARYSIGDSEHELGLGNKKRLNSIEKRLTSYYQSYKNAEDRSYAKAAKAQFKGKDPTKYMNKAKQFMNNANMYKKMNESYQKMDEREKTRMDRKVRAMHVVGQFLGGAIGGGIGYAAGDSMLRKRLA